MPAKPTADEIKRLLRLEELPLEGGYFRQTYVADDLTLKAHLPARYGEDKHFSSAIFFLLTPTVFSALHKLPTDEIYHYYLGDPAELLELRPDGTAGTVTLGADIVNGHSLQHVVRRGHWQGSRVTPGGEWCLLGTTMAPAYTQKDFTLGQRAALTREYTGHKEIIRSLTRT